MSYSPPRHPWTIVARREVMATLTDKSFWISTLSIVGIMVIAFAASFFMGQSQNSRVGATSDEAAEIASLAASIAGTDYVIYRVDSSELEQDVDDGTADIGIDRTANGWRLILADVRDQPWEFEAAIEQYALNANAQRLGIDPAELERGAEITYRVAGGQGSEDASVALIAGIVFALLFFMSAMLYGLQISQSVAEEKESRTVEILAAAVPTRQLLVGKVVGASTLALGQLLIFITVGLLGLSQTEYAEILPMITSAAGWFVLFFLAGFAALSCLWAAAGAMATRVQDVNATTMPLMILLTVVYLAGFTATGAMASVLSYVPVLSSVLMPQRLMTGTASWVDALIALALTCAFMAVAILIGERIYRRSLLQTSSVMKFGDLFKASKEL
ncbi:MAG: ABC transporter permease [Arachnia sp.]